MVKVTYTVTSSNHVSYCKTLRQMEQAKREHMALYGRIPKVTTNYEKISEPSPCFHRGCVGVSRSDYHPAI